MSIVISVIYFIYSHHVCIVKNRVQFLFLFYFFYLPLLRYECWKITSYECWKITSSLTIHRHNHYLLSCHIKKNFILFPALTPFLFFPSYCCIKAKSFIISIQYPTHQYSLLSSIIFLFPHFVTCIKNQK